MVENFSNESYLLKLVSREPLDEGGLARPRIADDDHGAVRLARHLHHCLRTNLNRN